MEFVLGLTVGLITAAVIFLYSLMAAALFSERDKGFPLLFLSGIGFVGVVATWADVGIDFVLADGPVSIGFLIGFAGFLRISGADRDIYGLLRGLGVDNAASVNQQQAQEHNDEKIVSAAHTGDDALSTLQRTYEERFGQPFPVALAKQLTRDQQTEYLQRALSEGRLVIFK